MHLSVRAFFYASLSRNSVHTCIFLCVLSYMPLCRGTPPVIPYTAVYVRVDVEFRILRFRIFRDRAL